MKKSKKIAILTQPLGKNYGGIVQNFALQFVLKSFGYEVTTIDRDFTLHSWFRRNLSFYKRKIQSIINKNKIYIFDQKDINFIFFNCTEFINQNISRTNKIRSSEELSNYFRQNKYEIVIVGSDQVWRPKYSPKIYNYFLDFLSENTSVRKVAYAASFGTDEWEYSVEETLECKRLVQDFDLITVRERSATKLVLHNFGREALFVLDPTLLMLKENYIDLINRQKGLKENSGIYCYLLDRSKERQKIINKIERKLDKEVYQCQPALSYLNPISKQLEDYKYPMVEQWLKGFMDADFVVTDSFHGTVFAILFNKPFVSIANNERGASRFESLLSELGLLNRLVYNIGDLTDELIFEGLDFTPVNKRIEYLRSNSLELLISSFN